MQSKIENQKSKIEVTLSPRLRLKQALKKAGIDNPATVTSLTVFGILTEKDFEYIRKNMAETLQELDMGKATIEGNEFPDDAFENCKGLISVAIPDGVASIRGGIFRYCERLSSVTFSKSVKDICEDAFWDCDEIKTVTCLSSVPPFSRKGMMWQWDFEDCLLCVPTKAAKRYMKAERWKKFDNIAVFTDDLAQTTIIARAQNRKADYDFHDEFNHHDVVVVGKGGKFGYINRRGEEITPLKYDYAEELRGCGKVQIGGKWGLINEYGKELIPLIYDEVKRGGSRWFRYPVIVRLGDKYGYVNVKNGKVVIPIKYDDVKEWIIYSLGKIEITDIEKPRKRRRRNYHIACVKVGDKWGAINLRDRVVIPMIYDELNIIQGTFPNPAKFNGKWGYISKNGKTIIDFEYDEAGKFKDGLARVQKDGKYGFITAKGEVVIPFEYDDCQESFYTQTGKNHKERVLPIWVKRGDKYGFVNIEGKEIIKPIYEFAGSFSELKDDRTLAAVVKNGAVGFINENGKIMIPCMYDDDFENYRNYGFSWNDCVNVMFGGKWGVIDAKNSVIIPFLYDEFLNIYGAGFRCAMRDGKKLTIDAKGNERELKKGPNARTFKDYVYAVEWAQVAESFKALFNVQYGLDVYETNFNNFKNKQFKPSDDYIRISAEDDDDDGDYGYYKSGLSIDMFSVAAEKTFTFFDWDEILDMEVRIEDNLTLSDADVVAACIYRACDDGIMTEDSIKKLLKWYRRR